MSVIKEEFRLTVYAPRSVDSAEATVLTPIAGAPHALEFKVATVTGITGFQPYLGRPSGRFGKLDPLRHQTSVAQVEVEVQDAYVSSNTARFVTAFFGDTRARNRAKGLKGLLEIRRTVDGSAGAWTSWFIGRIEEISKGRPGAEGAAYRFTFKGYRVEETRNVFVGPPHDAVNYCYPCPLLPLGLQERPAGDGKGWKGLAKVPRASGKLRINSSVGDYVAINQGGGITSGLVPQILRLSKALSSLLDQRKLHPEDGRYIITPNVRCRLKRSDTGVEGDFWLRPIRLGTITPYDGQDSSPLWHTKDGLIVAFGIVPIVSTSTRGHPYKYMPLPPDNTDVTFYLYNAGPPTKAAPLLLDDVDPVTFWKHLLDGYFSQLDDNGDVARVKIDYDGDKFTLAAPTGLLDTFPKLSGCIYETEDLANHLTGKVLPIIKAAARIDGSGRVVPVDIRLPSDPTTIAKTITTDDYLNTEQDGPVWHFGSDALSAVFVRREMHQQNPTRLAAITGSAAANETVPVDVPPHGIFTTELPLAVFLSERVVDLPVRTETYDARLLDLDMTEKYQVVAREPLSFFGTGAAYLTLPCRQTANTDVRTGDYVKVTVTAQPNPASNQLGGTRVMLVLDRRERPDGVRELELVDAGPDTVSATPSATAPTQNSSDPRHAINQAVTLNASSDPVELWYAVTATSVVTRPAEKSEKWKLARMVEASSTVTVSGLPSNSRIWTRLRSRRAGKLPSAFQFPTGGDYVDTAAIAAPTGLVAVASGRSLVLDWVNGNASYGVMPVIIGVNRLGAPLPPGSKRYVFDELSASTAYTIGVKHADQYGGESALATVSQTTGVAATLKTPRNVQIAQGRSTSALAGLAPEGVTIGYGLQIKWRAAHPDARTRVQVSTSSAFAGTHEIDRYLPEGAESAYLELPLDATERFVRVRHERDGNLESAWSSTVAALPTALVQTEGSDAFAGGWAYLSIDPDRTVRVHIGTDDPDTSKAYWEVTKGVPGSAYPTVDTTDANVARDSMPYHAVVLVGGNPLVLEQDEVAYLTVRFHNDFGFGGTVLDEVSPQEIIQTSVRLRAAVDANAGTADVFALVEGDPAIFPGVMEIFETSPVSAAIDSFTVTSAGTEYGPPGRPNLNDRVLPLHQTKRWWGKFTDALGFVTWGFTMADRDKDPGGFVSTRILIANPKLIVVYDDDVTAIRVVTPSGQKNYTGLSGGGVQTYIAGSTTLDGGSAEAPFQPSEERNYQVDVIGGGTTKRIFDGSLFGPFEKPVGDTGDPGTVGLSYDAATGAVSLKVLRGIRYNSWRYTYSKTAFNFDKSAGTLRNFSGTSQDDTVVFTGANALSIGQTAYVVVWFYWGPNGTGAEIGPYKDEIKRAAIAAPVIRIEMIDIGTAAVGFVVHITDPNNLGGTLHVWSNPTTAAQVDLNGASTAQIAIAAPTPKTAHFAQYVQLRQMRSMTDALQCKFRFTNSNSVSSFDVIIEVPVLTYIGPPRVPLDVNPLPTSEGGNATFRPVLPDLNFTQLLETNTNLVDGLGYTTNNLQTSGSFDTRDGVIAENDYVSASLTLKPSNAADRWRARLRIKNSAGTVLATYEGTIVENTTSERESLIPAVKAPANAYKATLDVVAFGSAAGTVQSRFPCINYGYAPINYDQQQAEIHNDAEKARASIAADPESALKNGGGQDGTTGWTKSSGVNLQADRTTFRFGERSFLIDHVSIDDSVHYQTLPVVAGETWEIAGFIKTSSLSGGRAVIQLSTPDTAVFTVVEAYLPGSGGYQSGTTIGINSATQDWSFVRMVLRIATGGTMTFAMRLGDGTSVTGKAWFDGLVAKKIANVLVEKIFDSQESKLIDDHDVRREAMAAALLYGW